MRELFKIIRVSIHLIAIISFVASFSITQSYINDTAAATISTQQPSMQQDPSLNNLVHPPDYRTSKPGELGKVKKVGSGPKAMILIVGDGFPGEIFDEFMDVNKARYTMYAITLPGYGGTPAPPMPAEGTSYGEQTWAKAAEEAIAKLIVEKKIRKPVVVGHFLQGTQIALRLAVDHPDKISSVIVISGEAVRGIPPRNDPSKLVFPPLDQRISFIDKIMAPQWFKTVTKKTWDSFMFLPEDYTKDPVRGKELWKQSAEVPLQVMVRGLCEYVASDISLEYSKIQLPALILMPDFPAEVVADQKRYARYLYAGWESAKGANKLFEFETIEDSRIFIMIDQPAKLNQAIEKFVSKHRS